VTEMSDKENIEKIITKYTFFDENQLLW